MVTAPEVPQKDTAPTLEKEKEEGADERRDCYGSFGRYAPYLKEAEASDAPSAVQTLRMDGCAFRANVLEALGTSPPSSLDVGREILTASYRDPIIRYQEPLFTA
jgi:hypothetical protein